MVILIMSYNLALFYQVNLGCSPEWQPLRPGTARRCRYNFKTKGGERGKGLFLAIEMLS
jgi:hypothetical protein